MRFAFAIACLSLLLGGCSTMQDLLPALTGDVDSQMEMQRELSDAAIAASDEGNSLKATILGGLSSVAMLLVTIALSRRRRSRAALVAATGTAVPPSLAPPA